MMTRLDKKGIADLLYSAMVFHVPKGVRIDSEKARLLAHCMAESRVFNGVDVLRHDIGTFNDMQVGTKAEEGGNP